jgi:hypothetical protein
MRLWINSTTDIGRQHYSVGSITWISLPCGLGMLYAKTDYREQARTELSTAIELYRAMDMTFWLPEAEAALAQVEGR